MWNGEWSLDSMVQFSAFQGIEVGGIKPAGRAPFRGIRSFRPSGK
jgi:hypothetical protein